MQGSARAAALVGGFRFHSYSDIIKCNTRNTDLHLITSNVQVKYVI